MANFSYNEDIVQFYLAVSCRETGFVTIAVCRKSLKIGWEKNFRELHVLVVSK